MLVGELLPCRERSTVTKEELQGPLTNWRVGNSSWWMTALSWPDKGLYAKESILPHCGLGLFTSVRRSSGEEICFYDGSSLLPFRGYYTG